VKAHIAGALFRAGDREMSKGQDAKKETKKKPAKTKAEKKLVKAEKKTRSN
jgi:hypothetical protein